MRLSPKEMPRGLQVKSALSHVDTPKDKPPNTIQRPFPSALSKKRYSNALSRAFGVCSGG
jgi:hypothetical protein